jgi:hypothetical protein
MREPYKGPVRIADASYEGEIMRLAELIHKENGFFNMDRGMVRSMLYRAFDRQGGIMGVIGTPNNVESMIYMLLSNFWYTADPHWEELWNYVAPEYRHTTHCVEQIRFAKWCSIESKIPLLIGVISNKRTEGKARLYRRVLGDPVGSFFMWKPDGASMNDEGFSTVVSRSTNRHGNGAQVPGRT